MFRQFINLSITLLIVSCSSLTSKQNSCVDETYAAFDIGSGSTKLVVADRNSCSSLITKVHLEDSLAVGYAQDLSHSNKVKNFSTVIQDQGDSAMSELVARARSFRPLRISGVATQAFRQAKNGPGLLKKWNELYQLNLRVISQAEEARLAYLGVSGLEKSSDLIVWDIGGGSQQLTWRNKEDEWSSFETPIAAVTFKNKLIKQIGREKANPLSKEERNIGLSLVKKWVTPLMTESFKNRMKQDAMVVGLGGVHGKSIRKQLGLKDGEWVTKKHLVKTLSMQLGKTDQQLGGAYAETEVTNLILIAGLMQAYKIPQYKIREMSLAHALIIHPDF